VDQGLFAHSSVYLRSCCAILTLLLIPLDIGSRRYTRHLRPFRCPDVCRRFHRRGALVGEIKAYVTLSTLATLNAELDARARTCTQRARARARERERERERPHQSGYALSAIADEALLIESLRAELRILRPCEARVWATVPAQNDQRRRGRVGGKDQTADY